MYKILICDRLDPAGLAILEESGAELHLLTDEERPRLPEIVPGFDAIVVRSATQVTAEILRAGDKLRVVGRAGIGVDNVDVKTATELGVLVVNAPTANMISATEHTLALMLALLRRVPAADAALKQGQWDRKAYLGTELMEKTLGVVGFGRIGRAVADRARAFGMEILAFDPFLEESFARDLGVELLALDDLLPRCDVVTLHTPLTNETRGLMSAERLALMKPGAYLVNCARGGIVDEAALLAALESGQLAGAAMDVFDQEPPTDYALIRHPNLVATPHIGAQTREAQERVSTQTARMLLAALGGSLSVTAVNLPFRSAGKEAEALMVLAERLGRLGSTLLGGSLKTLEVELEGIGEALRPAVRVAALKGVLSPFIEEGVNFVNAQQIAEERGVKVRQSSQSRASSYPQLVRLTLAGSKGQLTLAGTLFTDGPRVVDIDGFALESRLKNRLLVVRNLDVPGVVGKLGTELGQAKINIAEIHLARRGSDPEALAVLRLDHEPSAAMLARLEALDEVRWLKLVTMGGARS
jgi:D-3-phosphoglycerate dehydrogenase